jgi:hypothetical protein
MGIYASTTRQAATYRFRVGDGLEAFEERGTGQTLKSYGLPCLRFYCDTAIVAP